MILQGGELRLYARGPIMCMPHATLQSRPSLSPSQIADLRLAASKMTGPQRRAFEAEMTWKYCGGNPLLAEAVCGWGRQTVALGLAERQRDEPGSSVWALKRLAVVANAGKSSIRRQPKRFVNLPTPMRNKTQRFARA